LQKYFNLAEAVAGKNITNFDLPIYRNWCLQEKQEPIQRLIIDLETDLPGAVPRYLGYMAADAGFLNPFPHQAIADAQTTIRLMEMYAHTKEGSFDKIFERAKSPRVYLQALVTFDSNYLAKRRQYRWEPERKVWWKCIKELDYTAESTHGEFQVKRIDSIPAH
jgi:hypothetical protein